MATNKFTTKGTHSGAHLRRVGQPSLFASLNALAECDEVVFCAPEDVLSNLSLRGREEDEDGDEKTGMARDGAESEFTEKEISRRRIIGTFVCKSARKYSAGALPVCARHLSLVPTELG